MEEAGSTAPGSAGTPGDSTFHSGLLAAPCVGEDRCIHLGRLHHGQPQVVSRSGQPGAKCRRSSLRTTRRPQPAYGSTPLPSGSPGIMGWARADSAPPPDIRHRHVCAVRSVALPQPRVSVIERFTRRGTPVSSRLCPLGRYPLRRLGAAFSVGYLRISQLNTDRIGRPSSNNGRRRWR